MYYPSLTNQIMDFMSGASRAGTLKMMFEGDLYPVAVRGGAEMQDTTNMLCDLVETIERLISHIHPKIAYVIGGLCDLT